MKPTALRVTATPPQPPMASTTTAIDILKTPKFVKFIAIAILSVSIVFLVSHFSSSPLSSFSFNYSILPPQMTPQLSLPPPTLPPPPPPPPPSPPPAVRRTGIIDETGAMSDEFFIGDSDSNSTSVSTEFSDGSEEEVEEKKDASDGEVRVRFEKYKKCEKGKVDYIPCLDNKEAIKLFNESEKGEKYERHCPEKDKLLDCVVPRPEAYQRPIPWPRSRDEVSLITRKCSLLFTICYFL